MADPQLNYTVEQVKVGNGNIRSDKVAQNFITCAR